MTPRTHTALALAISTLLPAIARAQCAMCGTAVQSADDPLGRGIFWSVLFLMSLPYTIVGAFVVGIVWRYRRSRTRRERSPLHLVGGLEAAKKES
ncbi:MAG: hypothetical protein ACREQ9_12670 [Candidatus Binatia bacterium]